MEEEEVFQEISSLYPWLAVPVEAVAMKQQLPAD
jgi:hypothetical protein